MANKGIIFRFSSKVDKTAYDAKMALLETADAAALKSAEFAEAMEAYKTSADTTIEINAAVAAETSARETAVSGVADRVSAVESGKADKAAYEAKVAELEAADATFHTTAAFNTAIAAYKTSADTTTEIGEAVAAEAAIARAAEEGLQSAIDDINAAIGAGEGAEGSLTERVGTLETGLASEASDRAAADTALGGRLTTAEGAITVINGDDQTAGSIAKAEADAKAYTDAREVVLQGNIDNKVDKNGTDRLMTAAEGTKLGAYPEYSAVETAIGSKVAQADYDVAIADRYTKSAAEAMVDGKINTAIASIHDFKGQVTDMAALAAVQNPKKGDVYNVVTAANGTSAEYYWNGTAWEEFGTTIDMSGYALKSAVATDIATETSRAQGIEAGLRTDVDAANAAITVLNGSGEGSVAAAVAAEQTRATGVEGGLRTDVDANAAAITTLNGADTITGSVAKTVKDAVAVETARAEAAEAAIAGDVTVIRGEIGTAPKPYYVVAGAGENGANGTYNYSSNYDFNGVRVDQYTNGSCTLEVPSEPSAGSASIKLGTYVWYSCSSNDPATGTWSERQAGGAPSSVTKVEPGTINERITANTAALAALGSVEGGSIANALAGKVDTTTYATDKAALEAADTALDGRVTVVEGAVTTLNGDASTAGSVAKAVADGVAAEAAIARAAEQANADAIVALQNRAAALEAGASYEFVNTNTTKMLEDKFYIVRNAQLTATLPTGEAAIGKKVRIMTNEAAGLLNGSVSPTGSDTINGGAVFNLDAAMDITLLYDYNRNTGVGDWVVLAIMG